MEPIGAQQSVIQRRVAQEVDVNATVATARTNATRSPATR
jgi:hypothetical protein